MIPLKKGSYVLTYQFAGRPEVNKLETKDINISSRNSFANNSPEISQNIYSGNQWRKKNAIYWVMIKRSQKEELDMHFVGLVTDEGIWGHVYILPGKEDSWSDQPYDVGVFTLKPKTESLQKSSQEEIEEKVWRP